MPSYSLLSRIQELAEASLPKLIQIRRHLHAHPELSFEEVQTGHYLASALKEIGIPYTTGWAGNGLVAQLEGNGPGPITALRADMDALPIQEKTTHPYISTNPGIMHACGHDAHMTCLLGAASILHQLRDHWKGTIKLFFQPAEEKCPGGAAAMIEQGALENPSPSAIYGLHVLPELAAGKVGFRSGMFMAAADELYLTIEGKGGHGAQPHLAVDPIALSATLITSLQQVVSRFNNPLVPCVLTFGKIWSDGGATNIIPSRVYIEGTLRTFDEAWRAEAHSRLQRMVEEMTRSMGGKGQLEIRLGNPPLYNHPELTEETKRLATTYLGEDQVVDLEMRMGAEDFASFSQARPSCFWRLGTGYRNGQPASGLHTDIFDIDESSLAIGAGLTAWIACSRENSSVK